MSPNIPDLLKSFLAFFSLSIFAICHPSPLSNVVSERISTVNPRSNKFVTDSTVNPHSNDFITDSTEKPYSNHKLIRITPETENQIEFLRKMQEEEDLWKVDFW